MGTSPVKIPWAIDKDPLIPTARFVSFKCRGCCLDGLSYGGYYMYNTFLNHTEWYHKECVEAPLKIIHSSHQHPLLLGEHRQPRCEFCGYVEGAYEALCYKCPTCEFYVDMACALKLVPQAEHPPCHDHPLVQSEEEDTCELCKISIYGLCYSCLECDVHFHAQCVNLSKEVNHPCHFDHPLKLISLDSLTNDAEKTCILCGEHGDIMGYHCSVCNFTACLHCTRYPPPLVIDHTKTHKHRLTLFPKNISCACNVCGKQDSVMPYVCLQCGFMVHGGCIDLPRVININRHDDRISFTQHLGHGYSKCGVCRQILSPYYGAYTCSVCPNYAVHPRCATRKDVWDGIELEGIPEDTEDIAPFKVVGDNLIVHRFHGDHALRLQKENIIHDEHARCEACVYPVGLDSIYSCEECCYILHEKCANLPMKKRLVFDATPFTLTWEGGGITQIFECELCRKISGGYQYISLRGAKIDVECGSLCEPFIHHGHPHPLYFCAEEGQNCIVCDDEVRPGSFMLSCDACDFHLGLCCATLPLKLKHSNDQHPVTLCCGEKTNRRYWCDICEGGVDASKWFYTCSDCCVTLHVKCVIGDFSRLKPGCIWEGGYTNFDVVLNNHNTRPLCHWCETRCKNDVIVKYHDEENGYVCSDSCLLDSFRARFI